MLLVELIPLNKGNRISLQNRNIFTLGRTIECGCVDNRISRRHTQLSLKSDGTVWIKSIHSNPTFYKTKTNEIVRLTKDKEYQLFHDDQFGLLPDEYFYRLSIQSKVDVPSSAVENEQPTINSSTIPKKPSMKDETPVIETPTTDNPLSPLPTSHVESKEEEKTNKKSTTDVPQDNQNPTTVPKPAPTKRLRVIVFDDDDDDDTPTTTQPGASNHTGKTVTKTTRKKRSRCPYGVNCYRSNPIHRNEASHPGDSDWEDEETPTDNGKKPACPYGSKCYRKNEDHLENFTHPRKRTVDIKQQRRGKKRKTTDDEEEEEENGSQPNEYDYNDSFIDDEDLDDSLSADEINSDEDIEWKPEKLARKGDETDEYSSEDSEFELTKKEAEEFLKDSDEPTRKKPRHELSDDDDG